MFASRLTPRRFAARRLGLAAVLLVGFAGAATAADLYDDAPPVRSGAYDDPRYADIYGRSPVPRRDYAYRDDYGPPRRGYECPPKDEISNRLERDGWSGFVNPRVLDRGRATVDARRPNGRPFRLELDRCSGEVLAARPLDGDRYGYGYDGPPDRRPLRPFY